MIITKNTKYCNNIVLKDIIRNKSHNTCYKTFKPKYRALNIINYEPRIYINQNILSHTILKNKNFIKIIKRRYIGLGELKISNKMINYYKNNIKNFNLSKNETFYGSNNIFKKIEVTSKGPTTPQQTLTLGDKPKVPVKKVNKRGSSKSRKSSNKSNTRKTKFKKNPLSSALINNVPKLLPPMLDKVLESNNIDFKTGPAIEEVVTFHNDLIKNHNVIEGTARFNSIRLYAIRLLEGSNPEPLERVAVGKKDRWPSKLNKLRPLFYNVIDHKCKFSDQIIRSILYINRLCQGNKNMNFTEIVKSFSVEPAFIKRFRDFMEFHKINKDVNFELITQPSLRVLSNGPNEAPKHLTSDIEAYVLINSEFNTYFKKLCALTGNTDFYIYVENIAKSFDKPKRAILRKLTLFKDKGNKCRIIAISDYWTQVLLEPLMKEVQRFITLRYKDLCSSRDHYNGFKLLQKHLRPGIKCYDITSWTEAFPSSLQKEFLSVMFGEELANAWYELVVNCEWDIKGSGVTIKYNRGQGMGTAGSFDIATATDLILLEMIYREDYKLKNIDSSTFNKVGDDLWCWDPDNIIYNTYTDVLGIDINFNKTKSSTKLNLVGEFVSMNINYGKNVTRISSNILRAVGKNLLDLPQLALHLHQRDVNSMIPIKEFFNILKIKGDLGENLIRTLYSMYYIFDGKPELEILLNSLKSEFPEFTSSDPFTNFLSFSKEFRKMLRDSYFIYLFNRNMKDINSKIDYVFDATIEFDSSSELRGHSAPELWWKDLNDNIQFKTSKYILAESYKAYEKGMGFIPSDFRSLEDFVDRLDHINQSMSFKELGIISTSNTRWRPKATKLFNLVKNITFVPTVCSMVEEPGFSNHKNFTRHNPAIPFQVIDISINDNVLYDLEQLNLSEPLSLFNGLKFSKEF